MFAVVSAARRLAVNVNESLLQGKGQMSAEEHVGT
jgi:hypothetical protein